MGLEVSLPCTSPEWLSEAKEGRKGIVIVHGLASCALLSKVDPGYYIGCSLPCSDATGWDLTWASIEEVVTGPQRWRNTLELKQGMGARRDGTAVPVSFDPPHIKVKPYPGLEGIATLNPGEYLRVPIWEHFIEALAPTYRLRAANYDWRRWGDEPFMEAHVAEFRTTVEEEVALTRGPVGIASHSLGTAVVAYCLTALGPEWTRRHISEVLMIASVLPGCPKGCTSYAHNPGAALTGFKNLPKSVEAFIRECVTQAPSMACLLPNRVGGLDMYPEGKAMVVTADRTFTAHQMDDYAQELLRHMPPGRVPTAQFRAGIERMWGELRAPPVPTHIFYSGQVDTIDEIRFAGSGLAETPEVSRTAPGDGTILASTQVALGEAWRRHEGAEVYLFPAPAGATEDHLGLVGASWVTVLAHYLFGPGGRESAGALSADSAKAAAVGVPNCC